MHNCSHTNTQTHTLQTIRNHKVGYTYMYMYMCGNIEKEVCKNTKQNKFLQWMDGRTDDHSNMSFALKIRNIYKMMTCY